MSDAGRNPDDYCYRHPDRPSFVLCERCGRTICLECQNHIDGRVLCPDDAKVTNISSAPSAGRGRKPRRRTRTPRAVTRLTNSISAETPIVSYSIMGILLLLFLVDLFSGGQLMGRLYLFPEIFLAEPWTPITSMVASAGILSVLFNGFSVWIFGVQLERTFGRAKYAILYILSGLGASVFVLLFGGVVASAGGAIFGLMGAFVIFARRMRGNMIWVYVIVAINLIVVFVQPGALSWQGAVGGLVVGALVAVTYFYEGSNEKARQRRLLLTGIALVLVAVAVVKAFVS